MQLDLSNPIHADVFLTTAGQYLTEWPEWSAQTLCDVMAGEDSEEDDYDIDDVIVWSQFEEESVSKVLELIKDATLASLRLLKKYNVEGLDTWLTRELFKELLMDHGYAFEEKHGKIIITTDEDVFLPDTYIPDFVIFDNDGCYVTSKNVVVDEHNRRLPHKHSMLVLLDPKEEDTEPVSCDKPVIKASNKYLSFEGGPGDAIDFVEEIHAVYQHAGSDKNKTIGDFVFAIEVALQNEGYMDEDFNAVAKEEEES